MKRKINLNRPEISSAEIAKRKNFDSVLKQAKPLGAKPLIKKPWFLSTVVAVTVAVVVTVVLTNKDKGIENNQLIVENKTSTSDSLALEAFYKEQEAKPCIAPPIAGLNVEYTTYKVIAEKGASLDFKTGSKITIPKNAFTDEKGFNTRICNISINTTLIPNPVKILEPTFGRLLKLAPISSNAEMGTKQIKKEK